MPGYVPLSPEGNVPYLAGYMTLTKGFPCYSAQVVFLLLRILTKRARCVTRHTKSAHGKCCALASDMVRQVSSYIVEYFDNEAHPPLREPTFQNLSSVREGILESPYWIQAAKDNAARWHIVNSLYYESVPRYPEPSRYRKLVLIGATCLI